MAEDPTMFRAWRRTWPDEEPPLDDWIVGGGLDYCRVYLHAGGRWYWCAVREVSIGSGLEETREEAMAAAKAAWA